MRSCCCRKQLILWVEYWVWWGGSICRSRRGRNYIDWGDWKWGLGTVEIGTGGTRYCESEDVRLRWILRRKKKSEKKKKTMKTWLRLLFSTTRATFASAIELKSSLSIRDCEMTISGGVLVGYNELFLAFCDSARKFTIGGCETSNSSHANRYER